MKDSPDRRYWIARYIALTILLFVPLLWAFMGIRQWYPIPVWSLFSEYAPLSEGRVYFVLRGETARGEVIDIPAVSLNDALQQRNHTMVSYVMGNASFNLDSPHPHNAAFLANHRGSLPRGVLVDDLLRAWGRSYNLRAPQTERLSAIHLDEYRWPGGEFEDFHEYVGTWRCEL